MKHASRRVAAIEGHMVFMTTIGCLFVASAVCAVADDRSSRDGQRNVVTELKRLGAQVRWQDGEVRAVNLSSSKISDGDLELISGLDTLEHLSLSACVNITDSGCVYLGKLTKLKGLSLDRTNITDAGLEHVAGLTGLSFLHLNASKITDAGLRHLAGLNQLGVLYIAGTRIDGRGLVHLKGLKELQWLDVSGTGLSDCGVAHLKPLSKLRLLTRPKTQWLRKVSSLLPTTNRAGRHCH